MHLEYVGYRLPKAGEWYGFWVSDDYEYRIHRSVVDFWNMPQDIYQLVKDVETISLTDRFDEWNW